MSHRMQVTLTEAHYDALRRERQRTGSSLAELVRRAVAATYVPDPSLEQRLAGLEAGVGAWARRSDDSDPHAELAALRPGLGPPPRA